MAIEYLGDVRAEDGDPAVGADPVFNAHGSERLDLSGSTNAIG